MGLLARRLEAGVSRHPGDLVLAAVMVAAIVYAGAMLIRRIWLENRK